MPTNIVPIIPLLTEDIIDEYTYALEEEVILASGKKSKTYTDFRDLMFDNNPEVTGVFIQRLALLQAALQTNLTVLTTGTFGVAIQRYVGTALPGIYGTHWTGRDHRMEWVYYSEKVPSIAVIVDDVVTSGGTVARLAEAWISSMPGRSVAVAFVGMVRSEEEEPELPVKYMPFSSVYTPYIEEETMNDSGVISVDKSS